MFKLKRKQKPIRYTTKVYTVYTEIGREYYLVELVNKKISELESSGAHIVDILPYSGTLDGRSYSSCTGFLIVTQREMETT